MAYRDTDRRAVLHGLAALAVTPAVAAAASAAAAPLSVPIAAPPLAAPSAAGASAASFVALGDWGYHGKRHQKAVAAAMAGAAAEIGSRCVLSVGDNFYPAGVRSTDDPHWRASFEDVYDAASLQTPWYAALGNHDYRGVPEAQVDYSGGSARWRMPSRYFTIPGGEIGAPELEIFVLDTNPMLTGFAEALQQLRRGHLWREDADRQVAWLDDALARSSAPWKIVVGHHPIHSGGHHGDTPELVRRIKPLLERHGVQAYLCGHDHALQHIRDGSVDYICSGAGAAAGGVRPVDGLAFAGRQPGFAMFQLQPEALRLEFRDLNGASLYQAALPRLRGAAALA